jgi:crossover junction endodeoxyribonuclease RuvC
MRIIGIDPGLSNVGWAILEKRNSDIIYLTSGAIKTNPKDDTSIRLATIFSALNEFVREYKPDLASLEETFVNTNPRSSLILGQARGVIMASIGLANLKLLEFAPNTIKKAIVGNGKAEKEQVMKMLKFVIPNVVFRSNDEADAIAIAYTGLVSSNNFISK